MLMIVARLFIAILLLLIGCEDLSNSNDTAAISISREEAMSIARSHVQDREAAWSTRLDENREIDTGHGKERHTVWVVEAVFPAGNKEVYQIDAQSGSLLTLSEIEALMKEEGEGGSPTPGLNYRYLR